MAQYIDKDALENILRGLWKEDDGKNSEHRICYNKALQEVQCEIDTLEVKDFWKSVDGENLPDIDRDVIVLTQHYPLEGSEYVVSFAHRPNSNGWDGKSVTTGKVEHYTPKTYDEGGWNIPNVKYWLDVDLPKEIEL